VPTTAAPWRGEATNAAEGVDGQLRCDPVSVRPFVSCSGGPYAAHWLSILGRAIEQPIFAHVNWFQRDPEDLDTILSIDIDRWRQGIANRGQHPAPFDGIREEIRAAHRRIAAAFRGLGELTGHPGFGSRLGQGTHLEPRTELQALASGKSHLRFVV